MSKPNIESSKDLILSLSSSSSRSESSVWTPITNLESKALRLSIKIDEAEAPSAIPQRRRKSSYARSPSEFAPQNPSSEYYFGRQTDEADQIDEETDIHEERRIKEEREIERVREEMKTRLKPVGTKITAKEENMSIAQRRPSLIKWFKDTIN
jgi:hypothetical protein